MPLLNARWVRKLVRRGGIHYCRRHLAPTDAPVITRRSSLRRGLSALHCAALSKNPEFLQLFLTFGVDVNVKDKVRLALFFFFSLICLAWLNLFVFFFLRRVDRLDTADVRRVEGPTSKPQASAPSWSGYSRARQVWHRSVGPQRRVQVP
eukprot:m.53594 g.53594  ORF g.53594 m.53594 type:complete len:150 (+) comp48607_c0_seq3:157-606(+)